jgi:hypothetical protein
MNPRAVIALGLALLLGGMALVTAALLPMLREQTALGFLGGVTRDVGDGEVGELRTTSYPGGRHNLGDVTYREDPPMGGEHADFWQRCGVFDHALWEEGVVHALEHGTVWIAYDPDLDPDEVGELADLLPDEGILSPREGLPGDVVITVWNAQLALAEVDPSRLEAFLDEYADGHTAPERQGSCEGGLDVTEDGVTRLPTEGATGVVAGWSA